MGNAFSERINQQLLYLIYVFMFMFLKGYKKLWFPGFSDYRHMAHECSKVVNLKHQSPLPPPSPHPGRLLVLISVRICVDCRFVVSLEGLGE